MSYLDPGTLAAIAPLELRARMIVEGMMTGMHKSPYFGYSVEFAQHRQYAPGDDIRHLDWKIMAKTDKLYLKQYQKETNLTLVILVDTSGSMGYSSQRPNKGEARWTKYDHGASIAAALSHMALHQQDRVGLVMFADQVRATTRPSNSHGHWRSLVEMLSTVHLEEGANVEALLREQDKKDRGVDGDGGKDGGATGDAAKRSTPPGYWSRATDLGRLFDQMVAKLTRRSLVVLISDLFDDPASYERGLARMRYRRHDLIVLQTLDHAELTFPFRSPSQFIGMELEGKLNLDPSALRKAYLDALHHHLHQVQEITRRFGFDYMLLDTSQSLGPPLSHFLARRAALVTKGKAS